MTRVLPTAAYLVLGLVEALGQATPYDLKHTAATTTSFFFTLPHTQIYTQCERLVDEGLLDEAREERGRRRRVLTITRAGGEALEQWRRDPAVVPVEARDLALLKLFLGADPTVIGPEQLRAHREQLALYRSMAAAGEELPDGARAALDYGLRYEEALVDFWSERLGGH